MLYFRATSFAWCLSPCWCHEAVPILLCSVCKQRKVIMPFHQRISQHFPQLFMPSLAIRRLSCPYCSPRRVMIRRGPKKLLCSSRHSNKTSIRLVHKCAKKSLRDRTASSSDTECPPDSDACYVQSRVSWGTARTAEEEGGHQGKWAASNQLSDSLRFKKSTADSSSMGLAAEPWPYHYNGKVHTLI